MSNTAALKNTATMLEKRGNMLLDQARQDNLVTAAQEKFFELMQDEAFGRELSNCASAEAAKELLDKNGVDFSLEEIKVIQSMAASLIHKIEENDGELSEEDLEAVSGGWSWTGALVGAIAGLVAAAAAAVVAVTIIGVSVTAAPFIAAAAAGAVIGGLVW